MSKETFSVFNSAGELDTGLTRAAARKKALEYAKNHVMTWTVKNDKGKKVGLAKTEAKYYD